MYVYIYIYAGRRGGDCVFTGQSPGVHDSFDGERLCFDLGFAAQQPGGKIHIPLKIQT